MEELKTIKKCKECQEIKSINDFYNHYGNKDGKHSYCKKCLGKRRKQYKKKNPKKFREKQLRQYANTDRNYKGKAVALGVKDNHLINKYCELFETKHDRKKTIEEKTEVYENVIAEMRALTQKYNDGDKKIPIDEVDVIKQKYWEMVGLG